MYPSFVNVMFFWGSLCVCELQLRELKAKMFIVDSNNECEKEGSPISRVGDREGPSESNSSGVIKEEISNVDSPLCFNGSLPSSSSMINWLHYSDSRGSPGTVFQNHHSMRMEEQNFFSINEFCSFFSVDQSPTL